MHWCRPGGRGRRSAARSRWPRLGAGSGQLPADGGRPQPAVL